MKYLILSLFFLITISTKAQLPTNIGFENNDLTGWKSYISGDSISCPLGNLGDPSGSGNCFLVYSPNNPLLQTCSDSGYNFQILANLRIMVVNDSSLITSSNLGNTIKGIDPYTKLPIVCPNISSNNYCLKLGNDVANDSAESVKLQFAVNTQNQFLTYRYASVLENGGHSICDQPKVEFLLYDLGPIGNHFIQKIIDTFSIIIPTPNSSNLKQGWHITVSPNNNLDSLAYSLWIPFTLDLSNFYNHNVELSLTSGDCAFGGHFGYTYIDFDPTYYPNAKLINNSTQALLVAPAGYESYVWDFVGNTGSPILTGLQDSLIVNNPCDNQYYVKYKSPFSSQWKTYNFKISEGCNLGIDNLSSIAIHAIPNPAKNNLTISGDNLQSTKIELLDLLGRKINYPIINNSSKEIQIDISFLSSQMYFIRVIRDNGVISTIKFFKE